MSVPSPSVKVCGVTCVAEAIACVEAGADAIGLNFWPGSPRRCGLDEATRVVHAVGVHARVVAVFVDEPAHVVEQVRSHTGVRWAQLHGDEPPAVLEALLPSAYKAVRPADAAGAAAALRYPGDELLVDASVPGVPGGTGTTCDWEIAARIARGRRTWLAGGLTPENVGRAIRAVQPFGVDVASGVERAPGVKDLERVRAFVHAVRSARS